MKIELIKRSRGTKIKEEKEEKERSEICIRFEKMVQIFTKKKNSALNIYFKWRELLSKKKEKKRRFRELYIDCEL